MSTFQIKFVSTANKTPLEIEAETFSKAVNAAVQKGYDLRFADFAGAVLQVVDFSNADLTGADFSFSRLHLCTFSGAKLCSADFSSAGLWECTLNASVWDEAILFEAALVACATDNADFRQVKFIHTTACSSFYSNALLPDNYNPQLVYL